MLGVLGKKTGRHATCDVNQHHAAHGHEDGKFNPEDVGQTQADVGRPQAGKTHQNHGKSGTERQRQERIRRGVGEPHRPDERHGQEQDENDGAIVNVANQKVVFIRCLGSLGTFLLTFRQPQQLGVQLLESHRGGAVAADR